MSAAFTTTRSVRSHVLAIGGLALAVAVLLTPYAVASSARAPALFLYPLPYRYGNGRIVASPQTLSTKQVTVDMPIVSGASGVVLMVYWSTLCPRKMQCDFSLVDDVLSYWAARDKKVILDVATIGFPIMTPDGPQYATPDWVLANVRHYQWRTRMLGQTQDPVDASMPDFLDGRFLTEVETLVHSLARYDGNSTVAQIRIATGLMGEDNPLIGPLLEARAGFTEQSWLSYTRQVADIYFETFKKTQLEFDIGRLAWFAARGSVDDENDVDHFLATLLAHNTLLAFNGLASDCLLELTAQPSSANGVAHALAYIRRYKALGGATALEAIGHASSPKMANVDAIAAVVRELQPDRLVLFADGPAASARFQRLLIALGVH